MPNAAKRRAVRKVQARRKVVFAFVRARSERVNARENRRASKGRLPESPKDNLGA